MRLGCQKLAGSAEGLISNARTGLGDGEGVHGGVVHDVERPLDCLHLIPQRRPPRPFEQTTVHGAGDRAIVEVCPSRTSATGVQG